MAAVVLHPKRERVAYFAPLELKLGDFNATESVNRTLVKLRKQVELLRDRVAEGNCDAFSHKFRRNLTGDGALVAESVIEAVEKFCSLKLVIA